MLNIIKSDFYRMFKGVGIYVIFIIIIGISLLSIYEVGAGTIGMQLEYYENNAPDYNKDEMVTDSKSIEKINEEAQKVAEYEQKTENDEEMEATGEAEKMQENEETQDNDEPINLSLTLKEYRKEMLESEGFALDKEIIGANANLYYCLIPIIVIGVCADFTKGSVKNSLTGGISRKKYYFSKLLFCILASMILIFFNTYFTYIANLIINGKKFSSSLMEVTKLTIYQLPLIFGIISILVSFAFIGRKTATFNTISIPLIIAVQYIIMGIVGIAGRSRLNWSWIYKYELQCALANLAKNPANEYIIKCSLLGIGYIIVSTLIGYYIFKKAEIK